MYKYLFLICFGIIIFILLNQKDTFNIGSQFIITQLSNIDIDYEINSRILESKQIMIDQEKGYCVLYVILKLYAIFNKEITTNDLEYIDSIFIRSTTSDDLINVLTHLSQYSQPLKEIIVESNINPNRRNINITKKDIWSEDRTEDPIYIKDSLNIIENNKLYMSGLDYIDSEGKVYGHSFLIYKYIEQERVNKYVIFDGCMNMDNKLIFESVNNTTDMMTILDYWLELFELVKPDIFKFRISILLFQEKNMISNLFCSSAF